MQQHKFANFYLILHQRSILLSKEVKVFPHTDPILYNVFIIAGPTVSILDTFPIMLIASTTNTSILARHGSVEFSNVEESMNLHSYAVDKCSINS